MVRAMCACAAPGAATRQDEAGELRQRGIHRLDLRFQPRNRYVGQAQAVAALARHRQIGTDSNSRSGCARASRQRRAPSASPGAACRSRHWLRPPRRSPRCAARPCAACAIAERGLSRIAAARHHPVDPHHRALPVTPVENHAQRHVERDRAAPSFTAGRKCQAVHRVARRPVERR